MVRFKSCSPPRSTYKKALCFGLVSAKLQKNITADKKGIPGITQMGFCKLLLSMKHYTETVCNTGKIYHEIEKQYLFALFVVLPHVISWAVSTR